MRCLHSSSDYFRFLDNLDRTIGTHSDLAAGALVLEFPGLRFEEARAVFCDWRARSRTRVNYQQARTDQEGVHRG